MAWIESHQGLKEHPKLFVLAERMGWSVFEAMGRLHSFWYWCLTYAPTGDLRRFSDAQLGHAVVLSGAESKRFVEAMVESCWIDRGNQVFRIHDWPDYAGRYLRDTLFKHKPEKWKEVQELYTIQCQPTVSRQSADNPLHQPTNRTNLIDAHIARAREADPPTLVQVREFCPQAGILPDVGETWWHECDGRLWKDRNGQPIGRWQSALTAYARKWQANEHERKVRNGTTNNAGKQRTKPDHAKGF